MSDLNKVKSALFLTSVRLIVKSRAVGTELPEYLRAGDHLDLLVLSADYLKTQGHNEESVKKIFESLNSEIKGTKILVELEDVLGNKQPNFEATLD